jgi:protein-S-isoprenylcysteine O-methyltransferase Ste14
MVQKKMNAAATEPFGPVSAVPDRRTREPRAVAAIVVLLLALPLASYYLWNCLEFYHGHPAWPSFEMLERFPFPTFESIAIVVGWLTFQILLQIAAPGKRVYGAVLPDGSRLPYRLNGWFAWWFTWAALVTGVALGLFSPEALADRFGSLLTTAATFACIFALYLYWHGSRFGTKDERVTNNAVCDFWFGFARNPRIGDFDLKLFCESRPGLIAWIVLDIAFAAKQYTQHGFVSVPMILVCAFQFWYVADYFFHEKAILTTWDVKHENFGFMLSWGNLVFVPFTYTIQAYYLVEHAHDVPVWATVAVAGVYAAGYVMFRGANNQKRRFRCDHAGLIWGQPAQFIETSSGGRLLTSGWWGLSRHMNYLGDLLMSLAWSLPSGFASPLPYFQFFFLAVLLVHRERRDHAACAARYGEAWQLYCAKVPHRIVPHLY